MPAYQYLCDACGYFELIRPMSQSGQDTHCPDCSSMASRIIASAPFIGAGSNRGIIASSINERAQHEPAVSSQIEKPRHGPGCGCCGGSDSRISSKTMKNAAGDKMFPSKRPWMISH